MQQVVAGGGTVSTQYLHNICTRDVGKMFAKICRYVGGMLRYNPAVWADSLLAVLRVCKYPELDQYPTQWQAGTCGHHQGW